MRALINIEVPLDNNGKHFTNRETREILDTLGQRPTDMPEYADTDVDKVPEEATEMAIREYCVKKAADIINRLPISLDPTTKLDLDSKPNLRNERQEFAKKCIFYAGTLSDSGTDFMVTRESNGIIRFRLHNHKIEDLQDGCRDLVRLLEKEPLSFFQRYLKRNRARPRHSLLKLKDNIKIFEHGLEESTISGVIIKGMKRHRAYLKHRSGLELLLMFVGLVFFIAGSIVLHAGVFPTDLELKGHVERLSTAMLTTAIVSFVSVFNALRNKPVIQWTVSYERDNLQ